MTEKVSEGQWLLLDACCLINLLATGITQEILWALPWRCGVPRYVAEKEVLRLAPASRQAEPEEATVIRSAYLATLDGLEILDLESEAEITELVRFATVLDDGEAAACALAVARRGGVATDDRKALSVLGRWAPQVPTLETPEILFAWARTSAPADAEVGMALRSIRDRARFVPRPGAPHCEWWWELLRG